jgi:hypothetical protein
VHISRPASALTRSTSRNETPRQAAECASLFRPTAPGSMFAANALTAGRHLDRGAIPAAGQRAILLQRHIDQFHQQEIAAHASQRDDRQDNGDVARR